MLERLNLHPRYHLVLVVFNGYLRQRRKLLLREPRQLDVVTDRLHFGQQFHQRIVIHFRQLRKSVIGDHVRRLSLIGVIVLVVNRELWIPQHDRSVQASVAAHHQTAPLRHHDGLADAVTVQNSSNRRNLGRGMDVRIVGVPLLIQFGHRNHLLESAKYSHRCSADYTPLAYMSTHNRLATE